ncbi:bifunctional 4-hydroxy-2-oxoglutarate aldolase/2-dehydro-3-deoxy-phosphogluconate aldolase [Fibrella sp. HMF5335]|uniref:Bifunctional 4-hydroxy-2-oxoglutarate aldolase/2-dehydro-3-deoxy-phosphogluconate aldolase n=1 Tax=Fibrella rubiginis TaxID=2817060 RepID=A0A939GJC0_9BACT|nr:bifunctional 4-hydroxy-2-oxoglutarate aldolase/2-dehydro-3-deoxy-phosphogluconate aldolase [Fibrella rubiginis]MBO0938309.1 bifunctional 4-hydroxy-2-oxoglutarate aldolase/2-dehydro-3-deoxy-phosphogluconate aldolase [Fibrella rubiginis]
MSPQTLLDLCQRSPIVPVYYNADAAQAKAVIKACYEGGLRVFEFTNRGEAASRVFAELIPFVRTECPDMALGIGTILTAEVAAHFLDLGADFVVQPITTAAVAAVCQERQVAWVPAAATLNEIHQATLLGADLVKVFPGNVLGPGFVKAILGPMPHLKLMVTGGVEPTAQSLTEWFGAGVTCVGIGSQLFGGGADTNALRERVGGLLKTRF